jgi:hypothetical protein
MLPPLATVEELQDWSPTPVTNTARAEAILSAASTLVRTFTGRMWVDADGDWEESVTALQKDQVQTVTLQVADRVYSNPRGTTQEAAGPFSRSVSAWAAFGLALTDDEEAMLGGAIGTVGGLTSVRVVAPAGTNASRVVYGW